MDIICFFGIVVLIRFNLNLFLSDLTDHLWILYSLLLPHKRFFWRNRWHKYLVFRKRTEKWIIIGRHVRILWNVVKQTILYFRILELIFSPSLTLLASVWFFFDVTWMNVVNGHSFLRNFLWFWLSDICFLEVILWRLLLLYVTNVYFVILGPNFIVLLQQLCWGIFW